MSKTWPVLYRRTSTGAIQQWKVWTEGNEIFTEYGQVDGVKQITSKKATEKCFGHSNARNPEEQAIFEAESMFNKRANLKYTTGIETAQEANPILPMLAHNFEDHKHKINWEAGVLVQPKFDGCVIGTTELQTDQGIKTIREIVDNKLQVKVLSYNENTKELEYKSVHNWFKNGVLPKKDWYVIVLENGKTLKCTSNHKILTERGWVPYLELDEKTDRVMSTSFTSKQVGRILGSFLGDGSLQVDKRGTGIAYRFIFSHTNKEYFDYKVGLFGLEGRVIEYTTGYGSKGWRFVSNALTKTNFPIDELVYRGVIDNCSARKLIKSDILKKYLTKEGLSLWIGDDGTLGKNNGNPETPRLALATHNFSIEQINEIVSYFDAVWGCKPSIYTDKRVNSTGKFLAFSTKDTFYILTNLINCQCAGVSYKYYYSGKIMAPLSTEIEPQKFYLRRSGNMPPAMRYDIEVGDNHNYIANGIVVHNCRALSYRDENNNIVMTTRQGKPWATLPHIARALEEVIPIGSTDVLDGELYLHGVTFQTVSRLIKKQRPESSSIQYYVYDVITDNAITQEERNGYLNTLLAISQDNPQVKDVVVNVPTFIAMSERDVYGYQKDFVSQGYEGAIVRLPKALYKMNGRSNELLKVKSFDEGEFEIVGYKEGIGRFEGCVIWQCITKGGKTFDCVPKGTLEDKRDWYENADIYVGKLLSVKYFGLSENGTPRFPVGLDCLGGIGIKEDR